MHFWRTEAFYYSVEETNNILLKIFLMHRIIAQMLETYLCLLGALLLYLLLWVQMSQL